MPEAASTSAASSVCTSCGMCCEGVLFDRAKAYPEEFGRLRRMGLQLEDEKEKPIFRLPCPHLHGHSCGIYAERFRTCRSFRCRVIEDLEAGRVDRSGALRLVATARELISTLAAAAPEFVSAGARYRHVKAGPSAGDPGRGRIWVNAFALERFLDRHFRKKRLYRGSEDAVER